MNKKRPCRICKKWFYPNRRVGDRQKVCSDPKCQRERQRRNCKNWRHRNPNYDREDRVRKKLICPSEAADAGKEDQKNRRLDETAAQKLVGLEVFVFVDEYVRLLLARVQEEIRRQLPVDIKKISRHLAEVSREEIGVRGPPS